VKRFRVELTARAEGQLQEIEAYIAREAGAAVATDYIRALLDRCQSLCELPMRGTPRDAVRPGLRSIPFRRRATIFYAIKGAVVTIVGIAYGGRDQGAAVGKFN
jgi:toxin ParE1/3/4